MNFKHIEVYVALLITLIFSSCTSSNNNSPFQGDYVLSSIKLDEKCKDEIIDFLVPMELENDTSRITDLYQLFISLDTTVYQEDEFDKAIFLGLVFNNDSTNRELLACYPESGRIHFTYLLNNEPSLLIGNFSSFRNNFKRIEDLDCFITPDSLHFSEPGEEFIRYEVTAGLSSINGIWLPDTVSQSAFFDNDLNNEWQLSGDDIQLKMLKFVDIDNNVLMVDTLDFEGDGIQLLNKEEEFMVVCLTEKVLFLYDYVYKNIHLLKRIK